MRKLMTKLALPAALIALAAAGPAWADDSSVDGYGGPGGNVQDTLGGSGGGGGNGGEGQTLGNAPNNQGGESVPVGNVNAQGGGGGGAALPFTGLDIGLLAAAGAFLLALGIGMRRLTRAGDSV